MQETMNRMNSIIDNISGKAEEIDSLTKEVIEHFRQIDGFFSPMFEKAGITYEMEENFSADENGDWLFLAIEIPRCHEHKWGFTVKYRIDDDEVGRWIIDCDDKTIKDAVKMLPKLLKEYIAKLEDVRNEYKFASDLSQTMLNCIQSHVEQQMEEKLKMKDAEDAYYGK